MCLLAWNRTGHDKKLKVPSRFHGRIRIHENLWHCFSSLFFISYCAALISKWPNMRAHSSPRPIGDKISEADPQSFRYLCMRHTTLRFCSFSEAIFIRSLCVPIFSSATSGFLLFYRSCLSFSFPSTLFLEGKTMICGPYLLS